MSEEISDYALAQQARGGDSESAEILLRKHKNLVMKCARAYFLAGAEQDDVVQEGMIGLYKAILNYNDEKVKFSTFAYICIRSAILDAVKAATREKHRPLNSYVSILAATEECELERYHDNPESIVIRKTEWEALVAKIRGALSDKENAVFDCYLEGNTFAEIARALSMSPKSADNAVQRVKRKVRALICYEKSNQ